MSQGSIGYILSQLITINFFFIANWEFFIEIIGIIIINNIFFFIIIYMIANGYKNKIVIMIKWNFRSVFYMTVLKIINGD